MSRRSYNDELEQQTIAVAATAYVINSIQEQSSIQDQKSKIGEGSRRRRESKPIPIQTSKRSSASASGRNSTTTSPGNGDRWKQKPPVTIKAPEESMKRTITFPDEQQMEKTNSFIYKTPSKPDLPSIDPPIYASKPEITPLKDVIKKKTSAKRVDDFPGTKLETASKPDQSQNSKHETITRNSSGRATDADTWERMEMANIRERYEKLNNTILEWESKKKTKATNKLHKAESELELKRAKGLKKFQQEMEYVKQVVGGARAQAEEKQRNDELKIKEKANTIRATGKIPRTTTSSCCFCF